MMIEPQQRMPRLRPLSAVLLTRKVTAAVGDFTATNANYSQGLPGVYLAPQIIMGAVALRLMTVLYEACRRAGMLRPGEFRAFCGSIAGMVESGEYRAADTDDEGPTS